MTLLFGRRRQVRGLMLLALAVAACGDGPYGPPYDIEETSSFDDGLEGWLVKATDLELGDGEIVWSIEPTDEHADTRGGSIRMFLENDNDAGKIWIERAFTVEPSTRYYVTLAFDFGTSDWGDVNLFTIIAGAFAESPQSREDLLPAFRDYTGHGVLEPVGLRWVRKQYRFEATSGPGGELNVVVGVWGAYEAWRTYFVDEVRVALTPRRHLINPSTRPR